MATARPLGCAAKPMSFSPLSGVDFDYKKLLAIREACSAVKMPVTDRALILDGAYFTNLLGDDVVAKGKVSSVESDFRELARRAEQGRSLCAGVAYNCTALLQQLNPVSFALCCAHKGSQ
jgi:hypothetical protein